MVKHKRRIRAIPHLKRDQGYRWADKDPVVDIIASLIEDDPRSVPEIARAAWLGHGTIQSWLTGSVKRPQNRSITQLLDALGKHYVIVDKTVQPINSVSVPPPASFVDEMKRRLKGEK